MGSDLTFPMAKCLVQICEGKIFLHKASADALVRRGLASKTGWRYCATDAGRTKYRHEKRAALHRDIRFIRHVSEGRFVPTPDMYGDLAAAAQRVANALAPLIGEEKATA